MVGVPRSCPLQLPASDEIADFIIQTKYRGPGIRRKSVVLEILTRLVGHASSNFGEEQSRMFVSHLIS